MVPVVPLFGTQY